MSKTLYLKPILWVASSKRDFMEMPEDVTDDCGHWLLQAQQGKHPKGGKPLSGFGSANIVELVKDYESSTFRVVYAVRFEKVIAVLHAFQKKSHKGKETPKQDIELIRSRLKLAEEMYKEWKLKKGKNG